MHTGHIEVLESIAADPQHRLQNNPLVWELLSLERLLPYPDESVWYFPHPLLTIRMVTRWRGGVVEGVRAGGAGDAQVCDGDR